MRLLRLVGSNVVRRVTLAALAVGILVLQAALPAAGSTRPVATRVDVTGTAFFNPCTGEEITITSGTLHLVFHATPDGDGGFHLIVRGNAQGVVATGDVTGDVYRLAGDFWWEDNLDGDGVRSVIQRVEVHNVLSHGPSDNLIVHLLAHVTVNPDGDVTASVDSLSAECRG